MKKEETKKVIGYKVVSFPYPLIPNSLGTLEGGFKTKAEADNLKNALLQINKYMPTTFIYEVQPVHEHFTFASFIGLI